LQPRTRIVKDGDTLWSIAAAVYGDPAKWRALARANALEDNVSLYYTEGGSRKTIKYVDAPVARERWHTLRVEFAGTRIKVILDGTARIELDDRHIEGAGAVGVWTKADSVTLFDDFAYGARP